MSNFRKLPYLDKKWAKCDLNAALKNPDDLSWIFNNLIQDQELSQTKYQSVLNCCGNYSYLRSDGKYYCGAQVLNCSCCNGICNASSTCICVACQLIDQDDVNKKSPQSVDKTPDNNNVLNSETFFESWMWSRDTPDKDQKAACIKQLLLEQREICSTAAENCLSASIIKQLLYIYERHFIALARIKPEVHEEIPKNQDNAAIQFTEKSTKYNDPNLRDSEKATLGLARVGTRAALNFSFAFLRRAWRSGEDTEMCSELLQDSLDALQSLPEASLFDTSNMSSLWIEAVEKSIKFLRQVVLGDGIPKTDRNISLNLLLELGIQKGTLSGSLEGILLLLTLWEKYSDNDDNRQSPQNANAPLYSILRRYQNINNYTMRGMADSHLCGPTESFLRFLTLPENDDIVIDLKQAAVIVMSHLDRLAKPHLPAGNYTSTKLQNSRNQQIFTLGYSSLTSETYGFTSEPSAEFSFIGGTPNYSTSTIDIPTNMTVDQIVCSENCIHILSTTGYVFVIDSQSQNEHSEIVQVVGFEKNIIKIAAHCEGRHYLALTSDNCVYSWGLGDGGRLGHGDNLSKETPTKIEFFADKEIVNIFCGAAYSAAISANGELYTWGRGTFGRLGHNNSDDKNIPTLVQALKQYRVIDAALGSGDSHTLCVTDTGNVFAWGDNEFGKCGYGQNSSGSQVPILIENLSNIYRIFSGSQFSVALSNDGCVYTWGKGSGGRLGHGSNHDHCYVPKKIQALEGKKVINMSVGSAHCLALLSTGELYGWGRNDYQQICPPCITRDPIISTPILTTPPFLRISGLMCGAAQSIVWCKSSTLGVPQRIPFVIDLCENTFRFLDQLLGMVCGSPAASENRHPPSQDAECIAVACLNIMRLQFHAIICNNISTKQVGLHEGSRLLNSLKSRILTLAGGCTVLKTIQEAAQWTLQIGWRILLPTPSERAQTLTSLLPVGCDSTITTSGQRFMTSLLVGSLMTEGGLQTALNQAINSEQDCSSDHHLPLLHLLKQLLKNNSSLTMARLNQLLLGHLSKSNEDYLSSPESPSPSLDLLHKFQRLLLSYIYSSKNDDIAGAEALLTTYLQNVVTLCVSTLTKAHEIILQNKEGVAEILQTDISDSLLYELLIGLVLLHKKKLILSSFNWTESLIPLFTALDNLNRLMADGEIQDTDDMGWPGIISRGTSQKPYSVQEEVLLIRKSDLENHILDGGSWIIINGLVYDVKDYNCDNAVTQELIMNNVGKDLTLELSATQHRSTLEYVTTHLRVGKFETNSNDEKGCQQCVRLTHFNSERTLAYLLGLRANLLQKSLELQPAEIQCEKMLNSLILRGGLQVLQPTNPFDEEKGEARSSGCSSTTTPTDADASNHLSIAEAPQMTNWPSLIISQRVEALLTGLGEARLTDPLVSSWIAISEKYCKENHLIWHQEFASDHPVIELERLLTAVLIRHQNLGQLALAVIDRELSGTYNKPPQPVADVIKTVHVTKWTLIKMRQQLNRSYKEVCAPMLEKCRFLLYEVRPAISLEQMGLKKLFLLYKSPRFKSIVQKIINEKRVSKIQMECAKFEDLLNVSIQSQNQQITSIKVQQIVNQSLEKYLSNENLSKAGSIEALNTRSSSPAIDLLEQNQKNISNENLLEVGLSDVATIVTEINVEEKKNDANNEDQLKTPMNLPMSNDLKMKTIDFSEQFVNDVITKLSEKCIDDCDVKKCINIEIVDFVMQEFCDVETLRRAMYCQIQRYQTRKKGLEMFTELIKLNNLLDAVKYNLYNGYLNISCPDSDEYSGKTNNNNNLDHILENLNLVTAYQKSDILIIHSKIIEWAVKEFQRYVNQEHVYGRQRHHGDKDTSNLGTYV